MIHVLLSLIFATINLDMSEQDMEKTGIAKLSDREKNALQGWLAKNHGKVAQSNYSKKKKSPTIAENLYSGSYIKLSDNTIWKIRPQDTPISQGWITEVEINITTSGDPAYPSKLTNSLSKSHVFAKKVDSVPKPPSVELT